tara:strand:+ start:50 stop:1249 length:1200 start_codon:yes stop_codon:yes gene_type:complete
MIKQAVILVGGKGTRLKNLTKKLPKPLIEINNCSFLDLILKKLSSYYFKDIYLLAGFKGELIKRKYHNKKILFTTIKVIIEKKPLGTGGSLSQLKNVINSNFLLLNGDSYFDIDLDNFAKKSLPLLKKNLLCSMALTKNNNYLSNKKLSNLKISKSKIVSFSKKKGLMNSGVYILNKKIIKTIPKKYLSLEEEVISQMVLKKQVCGYFFNNYFIDIGTKKNLIAYRLKIKGNKKNQKCVFLDRDGVINKLNGYVTNTEQFKILPGVFSAIKYLNNKKILVIIVTNQSAIGRGLISEKKLNDIHSKFCADMRKKNKAYINDIYYCPFIKNAKVPKYNKDSKFRKPKPGMLIKAMKDWNLLQKNCLFIGDQITDKIAAKKAGIQFQYYKDKNLYSLISKFY